MTAQAVSPSFDCAQGRLAQGDTAIPVSFLIWTTTPWTLPANVAIALRADATYGLYRVDGEMLIVAEALAQRALGERFADATLIGRALGEELDGLAVRHPFMDRDSTVVLAPYVDLETGTGAVHTAPGHGADDFDTGMKYGLPILNPVDAAGRFTAEAGPYAGMNIFAANARIVDDLRASGALWSAAEYEHSYPHCWRCHNPVIFRATAQWFLAMDQNLLRQRALDATDAVEYAPQWGRARQRQMIETHPEWCLSRQRTWGTPIPSLACRECGEAILDPRVARLAAKRFAEAGAGSWWSDPVQTYLPEGFVCPRCGGSDLEKEKNIVDIWFESGVTHLAVLGRDGMPWPSDLVLEGGDQFRGWFRSSLITAVAIKGRAPYRRVLKNGWVNDEQGRPMSKSRGTGIDASDAMTRWGADVLRLWAASVEPIDDVRFGPNVVEQVGRVYRNLRNRMRFMLSNLEDLSAADVVAREAMEPIDRLACTVTDAFVAGVKDAYDACEIHDAYLRIVEFESSMSSLFFDALKDPLYSRAAGDPRRRSAQSALLYIATRFFTTVAPVLSFTAEEAWQHLPQWRRAQTESVFDSSFDVNRSRNAVPKATSRFGVNCARCAPEWPRRPNRATSKRRCALPCRPRALQTTARARRQLARGAGRLPADAELGRCGKPSSYCRPTAKSASAAGSIASSARIPPIRISARTARASCAPSRCHPERGLRSQLHEPARESSSTPAPRLPRALRASKR